MTNARERETYSADQRLVNKRLMSALKRAKPFRCEMCQRELYQRKRGEAHLPTHELRREAESRLATVDHIIPRSKGGTDDISNARLLCKRCNCSKGARL